MRRNWTRDELILAFNLYCKLPYGQFNNRNSEVKTLGEIIGRSPGAVAFKLVNFVSLDPKQKLLGRKGATNIGKLDKEVFLDFKENFDELFLYSETLLTNYVSGSKEVTSSEVKVDSSKKGEDKLSTVKVRKNQDYFRKVVLSNYSNSCAITGINIPELIIASHIKPWAKDKRNRLNPSNGICLSATLDKAFDKGLLTINHNYEIILSERLNTFSKEDFFEFEIKRFENKRINLPVKFLPSGEFIQYHNDAIFQR